MRPLDDLASNGFAVICREAMPDLPEAARSVAQRLGIRFVSAPRDRRAGPQLDQILQDHEAIIVRPDRYVYGVVTQAMPLSRHLENLSKHFIG